MAVTGAVLCQLNAGNLSKLLSRAAFAISFTSRETQIVELAWNRDSEPRTFTKRFSRQGTEAVLICCPRGLDGATPPVRLGEQFLKAAFAVKTLGEMDKGRYTFSLRVEESKVGAAGQDYLILHQDYKTKGSPQVEKTVRWPIFFDKDTGLCVVGDSVDAEARQGESSRAGTVTSTAALCRTNWKGVRDSEKWEQGHFEAGQAYWQSKSTKPPADITLEDIRQAGRSIPGAIENGSTPDAT